MLSSISGGLGRVNVKGVSIMNNQVWAGRDVLPDKASGLALVLPTVARSSIVWRSIICPWHWAAGHVWLHLGKAESR